MTLIQRLKLENSFMVDDTEIRLFHIPEERDTILLAINQPHDVQILPKDLYDAIRQGISYGDLIARKKGFRNFNELQLDIAKKAGFETYKEFADYHGIKLDYTHDKEQYAVYEKFRKNLAEENYLEAYKTYLKCNYVPTHQEYNSLVRGLGKLVETLDENLNNDNSKN